MKMTLPYPLPEARVRLRGALSQRYIDIPDSKNRAYGSMQSGDAGATFTLKIHEERLFVTRTPRLFFRGKLTDAGDETVLETRTVYEFSFWLWLVITCFTLVFGMNALPFVVLECAVIWIPTLIHFSEDRTDLEHVLQLIFETDEEKGETDGDSI